jgi:hypothetical protein
MHGHHRHCAHDDGHELWRQHFAGGQRQAFDPPGSGMGQPHEGPNTPQGPCHGGSLPEQGHHQTHEPQHFGEAGAGQLPDFDGQHLDALLFGHLAGPLAGETGGSLVIIPIEHLDVNTYNLVQNTLVENTNVLFNAADGGNIAVGGAVNALSSQTSLLDNSHAVPDLHGLA